MTATKEDGSTATGTATVVDECPSCAEGSVGEYLTSLTLCFLF